MIFKNGYKREDELQSDRTVVTLCSLSGYDASALASYLRRICAGKEKIPEPPVTDQSHPTFKARISWINDAIAADGIQAGRPATNQQRFAGTMKSLK